MDGWADAGGLLFAEPEEGEKMRLVDREILFSCIEFLRAKGFGPEDAARLLVRHFYVDLDGLDEAMRRAAA